jgi:hypothetical protein
VTTEIELTPSRFESQLYRIESAAGNSRRRCSLQKLNWSLILRWRRCRGDGLGNLVPEAPRRSRDPVIVNFESLFSIDQYTRSPYSTPHSRHPFQQNAVIDIRSELRADGEGTIGQKCSKIAGTTPSGLLLRRGIFLQPGRNPHAHLAPGVPAGKYPRVCDGNQPAKARSIGSKPESKPPVVCTRPFEAGVRPNSRRWTII